MITLDIKRLCRIKGIAHPYSFLTANGFTPRVAHALANGNNKGVRFLHLEKLCRLFCGLPNDLFNYKPIGRGLNPSNDVLAPLRKPDLPPEDLNSLIASLPPDEVLNLSAEIRARYQKPPQTATGQ